MNYQEWIDSLKPGVGVSNSEAFQAGRESYEADLMQMWIETDDHIEWAEEIEQHIGPEKLRVL